MLEKYYTTLTIKENVLFHSFMYLFACFLSKVK